eukprot:7340214-Alexandrium_andersonii.AAC.1
MCIRDRALTTRLLYPNPRCEAPRFRLMPPLGEAQHMSPRVWGSMLPRPLGRGSQDPGSLGPGDSRVIEGPLPRQSDQSHAAHRARTQGLGGPQAAEGLRP